MMNSKMPHTFDQLFAYLRELQERPDLLTPSMRIELERLKRFLDEALEEDEAKHPTAGG